MVKTILVVDDSPTERFMTVDILSKAGYQVLTAENAEEGIAKARSARPDVIVMDVVMPGMNGYQATRNLKRIDETKDIPIIVCSSKGQETDKIWGMRQGASDYLVKPVKAKELLGHIAALGQAAKSVAPQPAAQPVARPAPAQAPQAPQVAKPAPKPAAPITPLTRPTTAPAYIKANPSVAPNSIAPQSIAPASVAPRSVAPVIKPKLPNQ